jgi:hypothetical protein
MKQSVDELIRKEIIKKKEAELKKFCKNKDYSRADELFYSTYWNAFYTGLLMKSELSLEDPSIRARTIHNVRPNELNVVVSRNAQIQMHIWYSILKNKSFLKWYNIYGYYADLLMNKAVDIWSRLIKITLGLKSSRNLILQGQLNSKMLDKYGSNRNGEKSWRIKLDNSNRFVYLPRVGVGREVEIKSCMFHYNEPIREWKPGDEGKIDDELLQHILFSIYAKLELSLPKKINSKFRGIIKRNYLLELFENPNLIKLG